MSGENAAPLQAAAAEVTPAALAAAAALLAQANPNGAKGKGKKKGGGSRWKEREVVAMLGFVREVLPRGVTEWELVAAKYAEWVDENGAPHRDKDAVKNKYQTLKNTQKSTGDPECPSTVREAKHIARDIEAKGECGAVEDEAAAEREEEEEEEEALALEDDGDNDGREQQDIPDLWFEAPRDFGYSHPQAPFLVPRAEHSYHPSQLEHHVVVGAGCAPTCFDSKMAWAAASEEGGLYDPSGWKLSGSMAGGWGRCGMGEVQCEDCTS
mmetsp:Transcript_34381/g.80251  ORF Transcript_34381/g.80251 Transcript_34381/m.80251 type:complete len:268 (-) Transcript_34381:122-925(-)